MPSLRVEGLSKTFTHPDRTRSPAVRDLSFSVEPGRWFSIVGPSGCGKSTTLRWIAGLEPADSGRVWVDDVDITDREPAERGIAMLFQNPALYPHLTVAQNMEFPLKVRGNPAVNTALRIDPIVERLGLGDLLQRLPETLSGGQRQRVALARAWVLEPKILLLDEPFTALDAPLRRELRRHLKTLQFKSPVAVVHVTHDQAEALATGDQVAVMRSGTFEQIADPQSLYRRPASTFVAQFIGSPGMNLIEGSLRSINGTVQFIPDTATNPLPVPIPPNLVVSTPRSVVLGVRAEALRPSEAPSSSGAFVIERAECRGPDWLILGLWNGVPVQLLHPGPNPTPGNRLKLDCSQDALHWFDRQSGMRIG